VPEKSTAGDEVVGVVKLEQKGLTNGQDAELVSAGPAARS
jgi:hypothetical protein